MRQYDYAVVIGRFQPVHEGHQYLFKQALELADHLIVLIGSANQPRTIKNPWSLDERDRMISLVLEDNINRVTIKGIEDFGYNDQKWAIGVQKAVDSVTFSSLVNSSKPTTIALVGFKKDAETSGYLEMFPQYYYEEAKQDGIIDATSIREMIFSDNKEY